ncbi:MAG TPA: hypothetical protein VFR23_15970 [Jiangellaceae bacterium]|nr:hypothetical protein [Jiangellaceae bacterium]
MTYTPDHLLAQVTYRQQQLRQEADHYRRAHARPIPRPRDHRARRAVGRAAASLAGRVRRSLDSLTEWPRPV